MGVFRTTTITLKYLFLSEVWVRGHHIHVETVSCQSLQLFHLFHTGAWVIEKCHTPSLEGVEPPLGWEIPVLPVAGNHHSVVTLGRGLGSIAELGLHAHWPGVMLHKREDMFIIIVELWWDQTAELAIV